MKYLLAVLGIIAFVSCSGTSVAGTETTSGPVTVLATSISLEIGETEITGKTVPGAEISCVNSSFVPFRNSGYTSMIVADNSGNFSIPNLSEDTYSIICSKDTQNIVVENLFVSPLNSDLPTNISIEKVFIGSRDISGTISSDSLRYDQILLYMAGTTFYSTVASDGSFVIEAVPYDATYVLRAINHELWDSENGPKSPSIIISDESSVTDLKLKL